MASALNCTYKVAQLFRHLHVKAKKLQTQIDKQAEQINFLTDLLRNNEVHESTCSIPRAIAHNRLGMSYMIPQPCDCWLSVDISDTTL